MVPSLPPGPFDDLGQPMEGAPHQECPASPVPEAADQEDDQNVAVRPGRSPAAAAQGKIQALPQEGGQGDVPPLPELRHRGAAVGGVEVHRQADAEEPGHTGGDVAVAGEIKVQLEGIAQDHQPGRRGAQLPQAGPAVVHHGAEGIRQQHLLDGAAADGVDAGRGIRPVGMEKGLPPQLGKEGVRPQDGAGGDRGEKQAVQQPAGPPGPGTYCPVQTSFSSQSCWKVKKLRPSGAQPTDTAPPVRKSVYLNPTSTAM